RPYSSRPTNAISNGILLRADIHTLFDLYLIGVDPISYRVTIAPSLRASAYGQLEGTRVADTRNPDQSISSTSLAWHKARCPW
ncbi:HNH endonuclease signature motif containing protein, partial [Stenotrophomonas maltophilia]